MQALEELRNELRVNQELTEIVDALKVIAVTEFWALDEKRKLRSSMFLEKFDTFFRMIDFSHVEHPFAHDQTGKLSLLIITSDERFMGGLNKRVVDAGLEYPGAEQADLTVVGVQGGDYLRSLNRKFTSFTDITSKKPYEAALRLRDYILAIGLGGQFGRLVIVYPKPTSFLVHTVQALPVLPCTELLTIEREELKRRGEILQPHEDVLVESSMQKLIEYMVSTWIAEKLLEVFEDARQAELSAKAMRLEESHQGLQDRRKHFVHNYHRSHHEVLDKGMRDTFSAQIMRRKN